MPWGHPEPQRSLRARAGSKRKAAERREADAARLRVEADELDRQWAEYVAARAVGDKRSSEVPA